MADIEKKTIEERIDKNKDNIRDYMEIRDFLLEDENQTKNIKDLGEYLNNIGDNGYNEIKQTLQSIMDDPEIIKMFEGIEEKVKKNENLTDDEMGVLYINAVLYGKGNGFMNVGEFNLSLPIEKICDGYLLSYIQKRYNKHDYNPNKGKENRKPTVENTKKEEEEYRNPNTPRLVPEEIDEKEKTKNEYEGLPKMPIIEDSANIREYCEEIVMRANRNGYLTEVEHDSKVEHRDIKDKKDFEDHVEYDKLLHAFSKYCEIVNKKHDEIIRKAGYIDMKDFTDDMAYMEEFQRTMKEKYPDIEDVMERLQPYFEKLQEIKDKYYKGKIEEEIEKGGDDYIEFQKFEEEQRKKYGITKTLVNSFKETPETREETEMFFKNLNNILGYQNELNNKKQEYGDNGKAIDNYLGYITEISNLKKDYSEQDFETISKYSLEVSELQDKEYTRYREGSELPIKGKVGTIFAGITRYSNLLEKDKTLAVNLKNIKTIHELIKNPTSKDFWITGVKNEAIAMQKRQEKIDKIREFQKKYDPLNYYIFTGLSNLHNGIINSTIGVGSSLGVLLRTTKFGNFLLNYTTPIGLFYLIKNGHLINDAEYGNGSYKYRKNTKEKFDNFLKISQSREQQDPIYDPMTGTFNFKLDNTIATVSSSIAQMICLIYGGSAISKGVSNLGLGLSAGAASKIGLFTSSFITQIGNSYMEGREGGLDGDRALIYGMLSATAQSSLELVSPNEFLLGKGTGLGKELISNICTNNVGIKTVGWYFLRETGKEIFEENVQEGLQLVAGNLINQMVNGVWKTNLEVNWDPKNFLSTAVITTLTTGITKGFTAGKQGLNILKSTNTELIERIQSDSELYEEVITALNKYIETKQGLPPNVNIEQLESLRTTLEAIDAIQKQNNDEDQNTEQENQENENVEQNNVERKNETGKIRDIKEIISILTGRKIQTINEYDIEELNQLNIENLNKLASICEYYGIEFFHIEDIKLFEDNIDKLLEIKQQIESLGMTGLNDKLTTHFTAGIESFEELIDLLGENLYDSQNETYKIIRNNQEVIKLLNDEKIKVNNISELQKILNLDLNEIQGCISIKNECKSNNIILGENDVDAILLLNKIGIKKMSEYINIQKSTLGIFVLDLNNQKGINNINKYSKSLITLVNLLSSKGICNIPWDDVLVQMLSETTTEQLQNIFDIEGICKNIQDYNFDSFLYKLIIIHDEDIKNIPKIYNKIKDYCNIKIEDLNALAQIKEEDIDYNFLNLFKNKFSASELWYIFNRDIPLTENDYKILQKILDNGITINNSILKNFNKLTEQDIKNIKLLQGLGIDIQDCLNIKTLTEQDIENLKMLQELGVDIQDFSNIKLLTEQDIENLKMLQEMGVDVTDYLGIKSVIEQIKTLTEQDIENLKTINKTGVNLKEHLNIKPREQAEKVKSITNKVKSVIEQIKALTEQDIENLKMLQELGVDIQDFSNIKLLTEQDIENLKMLQELNINFRNERRQPKQIKDILQDEINILKGLTETEIEFLKNDNKNLYEGYNKSKDEINIDHELKRGKIIGKFKQYLVEKTTSENGNIIISEIIGRIRPELVTLSSQEIFDILIGIHKIQAKSNVINYYIDFENGPYKTPKELLCAIKGISDPNTILKITDDINVIHYGTGIKFFIGDPESFYTINGGKREYIGGYYTPSSKIKELEGTVTIVNGQFTKEIDRIFKGIGTDQDIKILEWKTVIHEEQHNFDDYFMPESKEHDKMATIKDEIIAHMREGIEFKKIENALTSSYLHNYFSGKKLEEATILTKELIKYANDLVELSNDPQTGLTKDIIISVLSDTPFEGRKDLHTRIMEAVKHKKTGESFRRAGTAEKETVINNLKNCNSIEEIKYILNDPQYSHIGWGTDNKGGIEISHIIDDVINRRLSISSIPTELSDIVKKFIK